MQNVLITGGTGGIGSDVARRVVARGAKVALVAREASKLDALANELGVAARGYACDVRDLDAFAATAKRIEDEVGPIDGIVHAVGSVVLKPLHAVSLDDFRATLEINAVSAFVVLKTMMPLMMRRRAGSVVLFSTVAATTGLANHETIAAAKGAVEGMVTSAAISYARYGIRVNAVAPALTRTEISKALWQNETTLAASTAMHPLGRIGEPADIGPAVLYFLSDESSWTTGQILGIDGGLGVGSPPPKMGA
jgi:NAD(P)-dependent dehydrogenase (short-subunit alcohol dehydrogenase family)